MITDPKSITGEMNVFPSKLKSLRTAYGYTQQQVADMLGVSRITYANYKTGKKSPYLNRLYKLAEIFKVSVDSLISQTSGVEIGSSRESELLKYLHDNSKNSYFPHPNSL